MRRRSPEGRRREPSFSSATPCKYRKGKAQAKPRKIAGIGAGLQPGELAPKVFTLGRWRLRRLPAAMVRPPVSGCSEQHWICTPPSGSGPRPRRRSPRVPAWPKGPSTAISAARNTCSTRCTAAPSIGAPAWSASPTGSASSPPGSGSWGSRGRLLEAAGRDPALTRMLLRNRDEQHLDERSREAMREFRGALEQVVAREDRRGDPAGPTELWTDVWLALVAFAASGSGPRSGRRRALRSG